MKKHKGFLFLVLVIVLFVLTACGAQEDRQNSDGDKLKIIATFYPMYEFTKEVAGDKADVELLIPAGTEPHDFEPSAKDLAKISEADAFVYNSPELETWTEQLTDSVDTEKTTVIEASKGIDLMEGSEEEHDHEGEEADHDHEEAHHHDLDPHVWLDPVLAIQEVENIQAELSKKEPDNKSVYEENAAAYIEKLNQLNTKYQDAFQNASNKTFVTQHAAFGYLANQYGLTQEAIAGISPDQEPSPSRLAELKDYVEEHDVRVIYFEENASSKVAETLSNETGVKLAVLNPLESLTNKQIEAGENYISVMEENLAALQETIK